MSIGKPICLPSLVWASLVFQSRYWDETFLKPRSFRSRKWPALGRKDAMSSPLMPVMSGTEVPAAMVVVSFCLKSPPMDAAVRVIALLKWVFASATTLSLSAPPQYHRVRFLPFLVPLDPELPPQ